MYIVIMPAKVVSFINLKGGVGNKIVLIISLKTLTKEFILKCQ